jgi:hypothetical protein
MFGFCLVVYKSCSGLRLMPDASFAGIVATYPGTDLVGLVACSSLAHRQMDSSEDITNC